MQVEKMFNIPRMDFEFEDFIIENNIEVNVGFHLISQKKKTSIPFSWGPGIQTFGHEIIGSVKFSTGSTSAHWKKSLLHKNGTEPVTPVLEHNSILLEPNQAE